MITIKFLLNGRTKVEADLEDHELSWALKQIDATLPTIVGNCAVLTTVGNLTRIHRIRRAA